MKDNSIGNAITIIIFFFVSLFIYTKFAGPISFSVNNVNTENATPFQTTGTGEVKATPDKASVSMGVSANASTADAAKAQANTVINKVTADLKGLGIAEKDIKTTNFSVYPNNPSETTPVTDQVMIAPARPTASGYTASANIEVQTSSVDLANKAIDVGTNDGANVVGGVSFTFNDNEQKKLEQEARVKAVADAKEKAQNLASAAGIKLGKIISISESGGGFPMYAAMNKEGSAPAADSTQLSPGENTVSITVTLTFETN